MDKNLRQLIDDAVLAEEIFGIDELEEFADNLRKRKEKAELCPTAS